MQFWIVSILLAFSGAQAAMKPAIRCESLFYLPLELKELNDVPVYVKSETSFFVDFPEAGFRFEGDLNEGQLTFFAFLSFPEYGIRSSIHGRQLYDEMMAHFGVENIQKIAGIWLEGTNLEQFNAGIAKGLSASEAALDTWSGHQAQRYGFTRVVIVEINSWGKQELVEVEFHRPKL